MPNDESRVWEEASFRGEIDELDFRHDASGEMAEYTSGNFQQTVGVYLQERVYMAAHDGSCGTQNWERLEIQEERNNTLK